MMSGFQLNVVFFTTKALVQGLFLNFLFNRVVDVIVVYLYNFIFTIITLTLPRQAFENETFLIIQHYLSNVNNSSCFGVGSYQC